MKISPVFSYAYGILFVLLISLSSIALARLDFFINLHISPLIIGIVLGIFLSLFYKKSQNLAHKTESGIAFSAKKILRLGIILYGVNVSLSDINNVGFTGIALAVGIVVFILVVGIFIGIKILKLDKELAILVSAGSAICGAAAVLAMEAALKSAPHKGIIAVGTVVVFGLIGMFAYPLLFQLGFIPLNDVQEGFYIGLTLHEVANVVGAGGAISQDCASYALITKMVRVILLAPVLLILPLFLESIEAPEEKAKKKLFIPWFAIWFLVVILLHSFIDIPSHIIEAARFLSTLALTMAMCALGLQIDFKKFKESGGASFNLAFILFIFLSVGGFGLIYALGKAGII